jgi:hypothetical protein
VRFCHLSSRCVTLDQVRSRYFRLSQVMFCEYGLGQVRSDCQAVSGDDRLVLVS